VRDLPLRQPRVTDRPTDRLVSSVSPGYTSPRPRPWVLPRERVLVDAPDRAEPTCHHKDEECRYWGALWVDERIMPGAGQIHSACERPPGIRGAAATGHEASPRNLISTVYRSPIRLGEALKNIQDIERLFTWRNVLHLCIPVFVKG